MQGAFYRTIYMKNCRQFSLLISPGSHCRPHPADHGTPAKENKPHSDWDEQTVSTHCESLLLASVITLPSVTVELILLGDFSVQQWFIKSSSHFLQGFCASKTWLWVVFLSPGVRIQIVLFQQQLELSHSQLQFGVPLGSCAQSLASVQFLIHTSLC